MKLSNAVYRHVWMDEEGTEVWLECILPLAKSRFVPAWLTIFVSYLGWRKKWHSRVKEKRHT